MGMELGSREMKGREQHMGKLKRKLRLDDRYAIWRDERWFADMARAGWHLIDIKGNWAIFEQGPAANTRYQAAYIADHLDIKTHLAYHRAGWTPVARLKDIQVFSAAEDAVIELVERDMEELANDLRRRNKGYLLTLIAAFLGWLFFMAFIFSDYWRTGGFFLDGMGRDRLITGGIVVCLFGYAFGLFLRGYRSLRFMRSSLVDGTPYPVRPDWRRVRTGRAFPLIALVVIFWVFFLGWPSLVSRSETRPLGGVDPALPLIRLAEIEQNADLAPSPGTINDGIDWSNHLRSRSSLLIPVQYSLIEKGDGASEQERAEGVSYKPLLTVDYYDMRLPQTAGGMVKDLIRYTPGAKEAVSQTVDGLDLFYVAEHEGMKQLFAARGKQVVAVRYEGRQSVDVIIPLLVEKLGE